MPTSVTWRSLLHYVEREGKQVLEVQLPDLQHFAAGLHDIGIHPRSQCRILSGVRSFYRFLQLDGYRDDDPSELLESPVLGAHLPEVLTAQEVDALENSIDLSKWEGQRNRAIIEVLFSCGLRVSELINLKAQQPLPRRAVHPCLRQGFEGTAGSHLAQGHQGTAELVHRP